MAKAENELNLGKDGESADQPQKAKGGMKKIIIIAVALLAVGGGAAGFFLMGGDSADPQ